MSEKQALIKQDLQGNNIRIHIDENGNPWFLAKDVCHALDISNSRDAVSKLDDDEKGVFSTDTLGGSQDMSHVNEQGLYELIFNSRKPEAKKFKKWVKTEVLPEIRKTGSYQNPNIIQIDPSKNQPELLQLAADLSKKLKAQEPFVMIANEFLTVTDSLKGTDQIAKELGIGEITLFKILREEKFFHFIYQNGKNINVPYGIHQKLGRVVVKNRTTEINDKENDGKKKKINYSRSFFTAKGEAYVCALLKKREKI